MPDANPDTKIIEALERRRVVAMTAADVETLDALLHENVVFSHTNGHADDKHTYLEKFRSGTVRYFDVVHHIEKVSVFGATGLINYHLKMRAELPSGPRQLNVVALTVWTQQQDGWKMVAHQPTVVDFDPAP